MEYNRELIRYNNSREIISQLNSGQMLVVDRAKPCGLIVEKKFHAEFAGPGAAVGAIFDVGPERIVPIGELTLVYPEKYEDRQKAYKIRRQWIDLIEQITKEEVPLKRAKTILLQLEQYFGRTMVAQIPDEILALLVGVLPATIRKARRHGDDNR